MFNKGKERLIYLGRLTQIAMLVILIAGMASCASSQPGEEFLNLSIGFAFSNDNVGREKEVTLKEFIDALNKDGNWKKDNINQWIYTIKKADQMTNTTNEMSILFVREEVEGHDAAVIRRMVVNGQEVRGNMTVSLFVDIVKKVLGAKGTAQ